MPVDLSYPFDRTGIEPDPEGRLAFVGQPATFVDVLRRSAAEYGGRLALIDADGRSCTYDDLWTDVRGLAGSLGAAGVRIGDRVAIDMPNSLRWVVSVLGAFAAGAIAVPIDQRAGATTRAAVLRDADPVIVLDAERSLPPAPPAVVDPKPAAAGLILYTSGTTGDPKGVVISQRALASLGEIGRRTFGFDPKVGFRQLIVLPLCHAAGCDGQLLPTLALGGCAVLSRSAATNDVVDALVRHEPDTMLAVPAVYKLLLQRERGVLSAAPLQRVIYGAAPVSRGLVSDLRLAVPHARLFNAYGMTEISNVALCLPDSLVLERAESVGFAVPGVEAKIADPDAAGVGELHLRGPNMADGYWNRPDATDRTFGTGWVRTGDIASIEDGLVTIRDRATEVINRGGEKLYPLEIENQILTHDMVDEVAVFGVADDVMGEKVGAVVVVRSGTTREELLTHLTTVMARRSVPEYLILRTEPLPRNATGKVAKEQLRASVEW